MRASRSVLWLTLAMTTLLVGCGSLLYGGSSKSKQPATSGVPSSSEQSADATPEQTTSSASSAKALPRREFKPAVVDILTVFQEKLSDSTDFDTEDIVGTQKGVGQLILVTRRIKLHRTMEQSRVFYVISGRGDIVLDGSGAAIRAGHMIVVPPGVSLKMTPIGEYPLRLLLFKMPGNGFNSIDWLSEETSSEAAEPEEEVEQLLPVEEMPEHSAESSSSEEFQTGTLSNE